MSPDSPGASQAQMSRAAAPAQPRAAPAPEQLLSGWGMVAPTRARMVRPESADQVSELIAQAGARGLIARGAGRSYGDAAQNAGGTVLDATALRGPIALDPARGLVQVSAGTTFAELLLALASEGFTLPVV